MIIFFQLQAECLHTGHYKSDESNKRHTLTELKSGKLLITELCFANNLSEEDAIESAFNLMFRVQEDQQTHLLFCAKCHIVVHSGNK